MSVNSQFLKIPLGAQVAVISPSGALTDKKDLQPALDALAENEIFSVFGKNAFNLHVNGYNYAGDDAQRLADWQWALDDDATSAIWCTRGGYGASKLLDAMSWDKILTQPKLLIGYSDATALHAAFSNAGIASLHAPTVKCLDNQYNPEAYNAIFNLLKGNPYQLSFPKHAFSTQQSLEGVVVGGNLSTLYSLLGTPHALKTEDKILLIEDWNENFYHLDRMLLSLARNGVFSRLKGLVVGSFTRMDEEAENPNFYHEHDPQAIAIINQYAAAHQVPTYYGLPVGHINNNQPLPLGMPLKISQQANTTTITTI